MTMVMISSFPSLQYSLNVAQGFELGEQRNFEGN